MGNVEKRRSRAKKGLVALIVTAVIGGIIATAFADAPDPALNSTTGVIKVNPDGSKTVTVKGTWQWPTHLSDCNLDKRAVGFAVDWNDPHQPGNFVATVNNVSVDVGAQTANQYNGADNAVHPTPATEIPNPAFGGCGTYSNPPGYNSGSWGPISHTYASDVGQVQVCVVMYDVHLQSNGGAPNNTSETTAGGSSHNGDNSVQKNQSTPLGNGCFTRTLPSLTTSADAGGTVGHGITDTANLQNGNNPTGSISFDVFGPSDTDCSQGPIATEPATQAVNGNGTYTSQPFTPSSPGTYRWIAHYSGDPNNFKTETSCNDPNESTIVSSSATITTSADANGTVGSPIHDSATLSGLAGSGPFGTLSFDVFGPSDTDCSQGPIATEPSTQPVTGDGTYDSAGFTPSATGTYRWIAHYSGDGSNSAVSTKCNDPNESTAVGLPAPTITTSADATDTVGYPMSDTATISGLAGSGPFGTLSFDIFGPKDVTCSQAPVVTEPSTQPVSGDGSYISQAFVPASAGTYRWIARYSGDANNAPSATKCNDPNEQTVVDWGVRTNQSLLPNDAFTVVKNGSSAGGSVTFSLYPPSDSTCSGTPPYTQTVNVVNGHAKTSNSSFVAKTPGTWRWVVSYTGDGEGGHPAVTLPCGTERFVIVNNG